MVNRINKLRFIRIIGLQQGQSTKLRQTKNRHGLWRGHRHAWRTRPMRSLAGLQKLHMGQRPENHHDQVSRRKGDTV